MKKLFLSKTNYCKYLQCPKMLWLKKNRPRLAKQAARPGVFESGKKVGVIAQDLFGKRHDDVHFERNMYNMINYTSQYLQNKPNIITEATFLYDNNFCMVDILKNDVDGVEIYEVKSSTSISDVYIDDASFQYYVVSNLGFNVKKVCIVYLNKEYTLENELDLDDLFIIEDITSIAIEKQEEIRRNIDDANNFMRENDKSHEPVMDIGSHCINPYECDFWHYCTKDLPKPNVFDVMNMSYETKFEKYHEGKVSFADLIDEDLTDKQFEQIDFEVNEKEPKIDKESIKELLDSLEYPLYFLDYETIIFAVPEIDKTRPYRPALPFQYSLHILDEEGGSCEHKEFLAERDDKEFVKHFTESLLSNIQCNGSVIVYSNYEHTVNNNIAELYPEFKEELERINENIVDFMKIFEQRKYYAKQMNGSYSIKNVLPALYPNDINLDYSRLKMVHDGEEASSNFLTLLDQSPLKQELIRKALLKYCELDTFALVKIYEKLREIIE